MSWKFFTNRLRAPACALGLAFILLLPRRKIHPDVIMLIMMTDTSLGSRGLHVVVF